jgi:hypothetical protein
MSSKILHLKIRIFEWTKNIDSDNKINSSIALFFSSKKIHGIAKPKIDYK